MTSEDDFQAAIDANPECQQTRLVFADFLQEQGDPRADGYRALARLGRIPVKCTTDSQKRWSFPGFCSADLTKCFDYRPGQEDCRSACLPKVWLKLIPLTLEVGRWWKVRETRREIEDAAALAFLKLKLNTQKKYLSAKVAYAAKGRG